VLPLLVAENVTNFSGDTAGKKQSTNRTKPPPPPVARKTKTRAGLDHLSGSSSTDGDKHACHDADSGDGRAGASSHSSRIAAEAAPAVKLTVAQKHQYRTAVGKYLPPHVGAEIAPVDVAIWHKRLLGKTPKECNTLSLKFAMSWTLSVTYRPLPPFPRSIMHTIAASML
jgi:hypothetical protein